MARTRGRPQRGKGLSAVPDLEAELDALFAAPPAEFVSRRDVLSRRLRAVGLTDAAGEVKKLKRPSQPVWAVNQLARTEPERMGELVAAAERLTAAPTDQAAAEAHRQALHELTHELGRADAGLSDDGRRRAAATLLNASLDPDARADLLRGRVAAERADVGFELVARAPVLVPPRKAGPSRATKAAQLEREERELRETIDALRAESSAAEEAVGTARKAVELAEARAESLARRLGAAEERAAALAREIRAHRVDR